MEPIFDRAKENPIITVNDLPIPASAVYNPGATEQNGDVVLLLRVEDREGRSAIHVARSENGVTDWRIDSEPILRPGQEQWRYEKWGCEDARVAYLPDERHWYITYTAYSAHGPAVALARSYDLVKAHRIGLIFAPNNKDAVLFPQRFAGRWAMLHRPDAGGGIENIWSAFSPDLIHWGEPHCVLPEGGGPYWDAVKVGAGPPPILTSKGWLLIYHGVKSYAGHLIYRTGAALMERERPHKVIARSREWIFQAQASYEISGPVANTVFPTGLLLRGQTLWMYYGAADSCVCLARAKLEDVLAVLQPV